MKGLILAGGTGSRLYPATTSICKQLLPIYDKPMIYYPISILMLSGIRDILLIVRPRDLSLFEDTLGDGSQWGISIKYVQQEKPNGLPEAYILGEDFINGESSTLILGDNFIYAQNLQNTMSKAIYEHSGATIFSYHVSDPERYGVLVSNASGEIVDIVEKPKEKISNKAIPGVYMFDKDAPMIAKTLKPSMRGETEITDMIKYYMRNKKLKVVEFGRGTAWFDSGTSESLLYASQFVHTIQGRQGVAISCLEEIAYKMGYIDLNQLHNLYNKLKNSEYSKYLLHLLGIDK